MKRIPKVHIEMVKERTVECEIERLSSPLAAAEFGRSLYYEENDKECRCPTREILTVCCLDSKCHLLSVEHSSVGTTTGAIAGIKEIFMGAIVCNAAGILCFHNHPSGDPTPSVTDNLLTKRLESAGKLLEIPLWDHIILGESGYYSYQEKKISDWRNKCNEEIG